MTEQANGEGATTTTMVAVGQAKAALPTPDLGGLKLVETQTKAIGVIVPPPDIRAILEKTAAFVAKNGTEFEKRILANEASNVKFNFLKPGDPYHAYYQHKVVELREGPKPEPGTQPVVAPEVTVVQATPSAPPKVLQKPDDPQYMVSVPPGMSSLELDVIKLTAQFVARNGKAFLNGLAQREHTNLQFAFLKPTHSLFAFFTQLCDAYSRVLMPPKEMQAQLARAAADRAVLLDRCVKRLEWEQARDKEDQAAATAAERERIAMQQIDWHDFFIVETIQFFDEEDDDLPEPLSRKAVVRLARRMENAMLQQQEEDEEGPREPEVVMDDAERQMVAEAAAADAAEDAAYAEEAPAPAPQAMVVVEDTEEDRPIKIVKNYVRSTAKGASKAFDPTKMVVSPITGELIALSDMEEHMRVSLIDPRWKEQREAMISKIRTTTRAADDEIARNLVGLAKTRPDIFGSTRDEVQSMVQESIRESKTSGSDRPVVWDGTGGPMNAEMKAQMKNIEASRAKHAPQDTGPDKVVAGPHPPQEPDAKRQKTS